MKKLLSTAFLLALCAGAAYAQSKVSVLLFDNEINAPVEFATVTMTRPGAKNATYAGLSAADGKAVLTGVKNGKYIFKAEILGYKPFSKELNVVGNLDLGTVNMESDRQTLEAASITAVGNPITIKKDTIEFNASSFRTTENDVLEDLLKKLPGVEVSEDGSITVNGETINKITIDGKTFFLDDPQLASKNIPAKAIERLKVIEKKSEQAEFTGIDDGEEEHVIDLSIKKGMMDGMFGNVSGGAGHDIPASGAGDWRYEGAGFVGKFSKGRQLSAVVNVNNTNNRGFNDLSGSMMQGMRGGGGGMGRGQGGWGSGNGISTSYMAGVNGVWDLLDNRMELGGNYLFNGSNKLVEERSTKTSYLDDGNLLYDSNGSSNTRSLGHRFGIRLEHKFSENTSIIFEPKVNFGSGEYWQRDTTSTFRDSRDHILSNASTDNSGTNRNVNTSGFFLLRQRLGMPGRTLTAMARYEFSNNDLRGLNHNEKMELDESGAPLPAENVNQRFDNNQRRYSAFGRLTYTEPLGNHFYAEANYAYNWSRSTSDKNVFDVDGAGERRNDDMTSHVNNQSNRHTMGANVMYQVEKFRAQAGFSAVYEKTDNETTSWDRQKQEVLPINYHDKRWKFAPQAMVYGEFTENSNGRLFYRASSQQPSSSQLMPVPDNTNPLNITFGNPNLNPYFNHRIFGDYRYSNKKKFLSFNIRFNASVVESPIVNLLWYGAGGEQFTMPYNGPTSANFGFNCFLNTPIAKSDFSISNMLRMNWANSTSYVGKDIDMTVYEQKGFREFSNWLSEQMADPVYFDTHISRNLTQTLGFTERLRFTYRNDFIEANISARTRMNKSWYSISDTKDNTLTWNNQVRADATWNWDRPGMSFKGEFNFNWYNGYTGQDLKPEYVLNVQISKLFLKKKLSLTLKGYDLLGQAKNLHVTDNTNMHQEVVNNTLGRYLILTLTYRFGNFDRGAMKGGPGMGPMGGPRHR